MASQQTQKLYHSTMVQDELKKLHKRSQASSCSWERRDGALTGRNVIDAGTAFLDGDVGVLTAAIERRDARMVLLCLSLKPQAYGLSLAQTQLFTGDNSIFVQYGATPEFIMEVCLNCMTDDDLIGTFFDEKVNYISMPFPSWIPEETRLRLLEQLAEKEDGLYHRIPVPI